MASVVDIANRALSKLGDARITAITDSSKAARAMNHRYEMLRDAELAAHPWRFAITRTTLPALASAPSWGYARAFQRPSDDLRPVTIGDPSVNIEALGVMYQVGSDYNPSQAPFEIIGDEIHSDLSAPLKYEYVRRETDSGLFPALFVEALACRLAMDAAEELTQSNSKRETAEREYGSAIQLARRINALWRPPSRRAPGTWMLSRYGA